MGLPHKKSRKPNAGQFRPGVSANPGGAPKGLGDFRRLARDHADEAIAVLVAEMRGEVAATRIRAAESIIAYAWGRPPISEDDAPQAAGVQTFRLVLDEHPGASSSATVSSDAMRIAKTILAGGP